MTTAVIKLTISGDFKDSKEVMEYLANEFENDRSVDEYEMEDLQ